MQAPTGSPGIRGQAPGAKEKRVVITIDAPKRRALHRRRSQYISPSTRSLAIAIQPPSGGTSVDRAVGVTPRSHGCTTNASDGTVCTLAVSLLPASKPYTANVTAYDGPVVRGAATGKALSLTQNVAFTVKASGTNTLALTLDGIPNSLQIVPTSNGGALVFGDRSSGFALGGAAPETFAIEAVDAGGNVIVGPGAPKDYAVSLSGGPGITLVAPAKAHPAQFQLVPPAQYATGTAKVKITLHSSTCSLRGATCSAAFDVGLQQLLAVGAWQFGNGPSSALNPPAILLYPAPITNTLTTQGLSPAMGITNGVAAPKAVAADPHGNLFEADEGDGLLEFRAQNYGAPPKRIAIAPMVYPTNLVFDRSGDLFVAGSSADFATSYLEVFAPNSYAAPSVVDTVPIANPALMAVDSHNDLFVAIVSNGNTAIAEYPAGSYDTASPTIVSAGVDSPEAIAVDKNDNLFVGNYGSCCDFAGTITEYPAGNYTTPTPTTISNNINGPRAIVFDSHGNMYVGNIDAAGFGSDAGWIDEFAAGNYTGTPTVYGAQYSGTGYTYPSQGVYPFAMVIDGQDDIYAAETPYWGGGLGVYMYPPGNFGSFGSPFYTIPALPAPYATDADVETLTVVP